MANVSEQSDVTARTGRPFVFTRTRDGDEEFFPGAGARLRFASSDTDTLTLPGLPPGTIEPGDLVTVAYKGTTVFRGTVATIAERHGRGTDLVEDVTVEGPWGLMSRLVYRQTWAVGAELTLLLVLPALQAEAIESAMQLARRLDAEARFYCDTDPLRAIRDYMRQELPLSVLTRRDLKRETHGAPAELLLCRA